MGYWALLHIPDLGKEFTFSGTAAKRSFVQAQPEVAKAALTDGAITYKEDGRAAVRVLKKYMDAEDRILEGGYREYDAAISSPPIHRSRVWTPCETVSSNQHRSSSKWT
jgi:hypothetical protein